MLARFTWNVLPPDPPRAAALARQCGVDPLIGQLLLNRGISHPTEAQRFFAPRLEALEDSLELPDMVTAILTIRKALTAKHPILVFGDSDVDGITASAIVYEVLTSLGAKVFVRLSNRLRDGYGFPKALIKRLVRSGIRLLILVDCGTNQPEEIQALARHHIDTIVLDHHVPMATEAKPLALVNPYRGSGAGRELSSAGLALKLAQALCPDRGDLPGYLDLALLGTLADYVPLLRDNRILVTRGLEHLGRTQRPGLKRLCEAVALTKPESEPILRRLIPRLNAAGRLGNPRPVWKLLVEPSPHVANQLVEVLTHAHATTKTLHRQVISEAHEQVNRLHFRDHYVMVIGRPGWHPGVMGPLASQLVERYSRPAIALALNEGVGVGSGRSTTMFNLLEALQVCQSMLLRYGGHPRACGLTLKSTEVETFRERINRHAHTALGRHGLTRVLSIDLEVALGGVTLPWVSSVERFAPFGPGNPRPLVLLRGLTVEGDVHGKMWVADGTRRVKIRGRLEGVVPTERYDVVASPSLVGGELMVSLCDARLSTTP